jgi:hypothetical protein
METNENLDDEFEDVISEKEDQSTDTSTYDIISYGADYTLSVLYEKMANMEIQVPNFQRKYVWRLKQASILIESFLLGLPVPGIFLSKEKPTGNLLVIDGQQRLVTCKAFRDEKFPITDDEFILKGIHEKWDGKKYTELSPADRKRFDDSVLRATIVQQVKPEEDNTSVYHIFQRLNTGGTILQNQEIRNSVYHGKFNDMLGLLNKNDIWREVYNIKEPNKRMKDEELILRFLSLYYNFENYTKPMNEFMSRFMDKHRNPDDERLEKMKVIFIDTIQFIKENIGSRAFRPKGNINGSAFDSVMYTISKYKNQLKDNIQENISKLFEDKGYLKAIREGTTDPETIQLRFNITKRYIVKE